VERSEHQFPLFSLLAVMQTGNMAAEFWHAGQRNTVSHIAAAAAAWIEWTVHSW